MIKRIPLSRAAQLHPFIDFLDGMGAPIERGLERYKLVLRLRHDPNMLISTRAAFGFAAEMGRRQGIEDFGWRVANHRLTQMSHGLRDKLLRSPTLFHALDRMCEGACGESSNLRFWLEDRGDGFYLCHRGSLAVGVRGLDEASETRTAIIISVIRFFTDSDWVPPECGLEMEGEIGPLVREELRDARIWRTSDYGWIRLPRSILANPPRIPAPVEYGPGTEDGETPALDLVGSLVQFLAPYVSGGALPSLHDTADMAGTSVRSLQRELARAGSSYRDVLQRGKFNAARELLKQPDVRILEVAYDLGFSDTANFSRFFRRFAGLTPREYRTTLAEESGSTPHFSEKHLTNVAQNDKKS